MNVTRILHYPGSKWSLAQWIIDHMPPHISPKNRVNHERQKNGY